LFDLLLYLIFLSDIVGNLLGIGSFGCVYEAAEKEEPQKKVAIKGFAPTGDSKSKDRDLNSGFDPRLCSAYTMMYMEVFEFNGHEFAVMPLMKCSLNNYLNPYLSSRPKKFLNDEVLIY
jgi:serine/threonine protein kinase